MSFSKIFLKMTDDETTFRLKSLINNITIIINVFEIVYKQIKQVLRNEL